MKRHKILVNLLVLICLIWFNLLARDYAFNQLETILINFMMIAFYIFFRGIIGFYETARTGFNKDHEKLKLIYESEHSDTEILHIIDKISALFMKEKNLDSVFRHILNGVGEVLKADIVVIEVITSPGSSAMTRVSKGGEDLNLNKNIYAKVVEQGNSMLINHLDSYHTDYEKYNTIYEQGIKSFIIAPLKITDKAIGLLGTFTREPYDFTGEELRRLTTFATHASLIIQNAQLLKTTELLSITDELTHLFNFRHFRERFKREFQRARRYKHDMTLLMCDIDWFKNYNDTNGHEAGNQILRRVAQIMQDSIRDIDFAARYGGEEFVIVLIETSKDNALIFADRLREKIKEEDFPHQEKQPQGDLTITIGAAGFPQDAATDEELIEHADQALYQGKKAGRNRVVLYQAGL